MNSLNIISGRVSPPGSTAPSRSNSLGTIGLAVASAQGDDSVAERGSSEQQQEQQQQQDAPLTAEPEELSSFSSSPHSHSHSPIQREERPFHQQYHLPAHEDRNRNNDDDDDECAIADEATPLLFSSPPTPSYDGEAREEKTTSARPLAPASAWYVIPKRIANSVITSIRFVLSTLAAPGVYLIACCYTEEGEFAPLRQFTKLFGIYGGDARKLAVDYRERTVQGEKEQSSDSRTGNGTSNGSGNNNETTPSGATRASRFPASSASSSYGPSSESESDPGRRREEGGARRSSSGRHARSKSLQDPSEEVVVPRRSIRIKVQADETLRQRKHRKAQSTSARGAGGSDDTAGGAGGSGGGGDISAQLKSPTSPIGALTKYPRTPAPPRPLIPRRQPSYVNVEPDPRQQQKTLILDLDETLIHSMSKGGRMGTGHMVEVRLNTTYVGVGGQTTIGPQHPILYFVHKRPHCDDFLRRVSKWFNLVVFTASVQEYADPVIDWLESDRKYFSGRYYRQHCTFRQGAFIKDLSSVEPDLSKVMILDNSPLSYMFHQDNAIPIQGWINDPTDNDLLHLVPFLEGLQYVSDVRALLALRGGEDGQHMA